jgi:chorismate mutase/prephenate dehydrogenase
MTTPPPDPLPPLRDAIADLDRALLELLRRRMEIAGEVGRIKAERGDPIVVRDVEHQVLARARQQAESCGVSEEVLEAVFRGIIRGSVERQHRVGVAMRAQHGERLLILGAAGGMGSWFRRFFEIAGHRCDLVDPAFVGLPRETGRFTHLSEVEELDAYAAVLVAVPLARTAQVLEGILARGRRTAPAPLPLIVEISSIKSPLAPVLDAARDDGARVLALHPMFGPGKSPYEPLAFVLAAQRDAELEQAEIAPFLSHPYTRVVVVPFPHHDRLMGWLLGLAHLTNLLFGAALGRSGIDPEELQACASTTFLRQAATARSVLAEDADLYLDIQRLNPFRSEVYRTAREALADLEALVEAHDRGGWEKAFASARRALVEEG